MAIEHGMLSGYGGLMAVALMSQINFSGSTMHLVQKFSLVINLKSCVDLEGVYNARLLMGKKSCYALPSS